MNKLYECGRCGVVTRTAENLCNPRVRENREAYCGTAPDRGTMCEGMKERLPFVCGICGRPAGQADLICKPWIVG